jgi:hypothetical protein
MNAIQATVAPIAIMLFAWSSAVGAQTPKRMPVTDARPLLVAALDSPGGEAHGVLVGSLADAITLRFKATSPIYIDVSTAKRYRQAGCGRFKVTFWQEGVSLPSSPSPRKQTIELGINYCSDGLPPRSLS